MYPYLRMVKELVKFRSAPALGVTGEHVSHHICWPWDLDPWRELNNGRTLTLYDLGRIPLGTRTGLHKALVRHGWGLAVAGVSVRYRKRVKLFHRVEMRTRCIGWDTRFMYIEQSMWRGGDCTSHMLLRSAITSAQGMIPPSRLLAEMGLSVQSPPLPAWVEAWITAEAARPWPPIRHPA
jgi:acyl-CoA thioesterase FadM